MNAFRLEAHDTLFLRDGRPFNQGEGVTGRLDGFFPPSPPTVVGAIRAAFARELGWRGGPWPRHVIDALGDGEQLAPLAFHGPHLVRRTADGDELLLPVPRQLAFVRNSNPPSFTLLQPTATVVDTDLGAVRLCVARDPNVVPAQVEGGFVRVADAEPILRGAVAGVEVISERDLWDHESRTGIFRDVEDRTTKEGALYQTQHVRVHRGVGLLVTATGLPAVAPAARYHPMGGESRAVWLEALPNPPALPAAPKLAPGDDGVVRYTVTFLTPADLGDAWQRPNATIPDLPGALVSACTGRMVRIGGWDGIRNQPKPLRAYVAPGSTLFLEARSDAIPRILALHGHAIGHRTAWGFGQVLIGTWRSE
jgi:CRISPR-associated protein Cmr3